MAPPDFYLFQKLKSHLRGTQYGSNEGAIEAVNEYLGDQENAFFFEGTRKLEHNNNVRTLVSLQCGPYFLLLTNDKSVVFNITLKCM